MSDNPPDENSTLIGRLSSSTDIVITIDGDYNISYFNKVAEKTFGYNQDELLGQPLVMLLPKYARQKHDLYVDHFAISGDNKRSMGDRMAVSGLTKGGEILILDISIEKHENEEKHLYSAICRKLA